MLGCSCRLQRQDAGRFIFNNKEQVPIHLAGKGVSILTPQV
jgi:hypothetical protein